MNRTAAHNYRIPPAVTSLPVAVLVVAMSYAVVAQIGYMTTTLPGHISPIFPPAGIALAAVLILGRPALLGVWLGSFLANIIPHFLGSAPTAKLLTELWIEGVIAIGAMAGAGIGAFLVRRLCADQYPLHSARSLLVLLTVGALGCCIISPTVGVLTLSLAGITPWPIFGYSWLTWWLGDAVGAILAAPLILAWLHPQPIELGPKRIAEAALLSGILLLLCSFVFFRSLPLEYSVMPLLLLAAFRFDMRGATAAAAAIAVLATIGTSHGTSPFASGSVNESLLLLHSFLGVNVICALFLAALLAERRRAERALRQSERNYREVFNAANDAIFVHDADTGAVLDVNESMARLYGFARDAVHRLTIEDCSLGTSPYSLVDAQRWMAKAIAEGPQVFEWQARKSSGELFWVEVALRSANISGQRRILAVVRDISDRKLAEQTLKDSEEKFRTLFENAGDAIFLMHGDRFVDCNLRTIGMFGCNTLDQILGHPPYDFSPRKQPDGRESRQVAIERINAAFAGEPQFFEWVHTRLDGTVFPAEVTLNRIELGGRLLLQAIVRDITGRKQAENDLRRARDEAQAASRAKDHFLAAASHELRTPLTPILLLASALEKDPTLSPEAQEDLAVIREHVDLEKRLVDDLLDFSAIYAGKLQLRPQNTSLHAALQAAVETCRSELNRKQLKLDVSLQATGDTICADPVRLRQIFWNILQNAAKFTPPHGRISVRSDDNGTDFVSVAIADTGKGIDPETMARLFLPFEQGPRTDVQHYGGLGLGLAIARTLTEGHHGTIKATSAGLGHGSTFTLRFPKAPCAQAETPTGKTQSPDPALADTSTGIAEPKGLRILLIEDHDQTREVLTRLLAAEQHCVTPVANSSEALAAAANQAFDLVISDIGLPDGSGLDLMPRLKASHRLKGIALSGYSSETDKEAAERAGFCEHLSKPVSLHDLRRALWRAMQVDGTHHIPGG